MLSANDTRLLIWIAQNVGHLFTSNAYVIISFDGDVDDSAALQQRLNRENRRVSVLPKSHEIHIMCFALVPVGVRRREVTLHYKPQA